MEPFDVERAPYVLPAERWREIRKELGMTQTQLAQALGLGKRGQITISRAEHHTPGSARKPSAQLSRALELLQTNVRLFRALAATQLRLDVLRNELGPNVGD